MDYGHKERFFIQARKVVKEINNLADFNDLLSEIEIVCLENFIDKIEKIIENNC